jgi:hypothetical protein
MADQHAPPDKPERNFDRRRHLWIMQLVKDSRLTPTAFRVGILLSEQYMNRKKGGLAWPSVATLRADLDVCERAMQDAIKLLVDREHLTRENRVGKTPFYAMRENTKTPSEKTEEIQGIKGINPRTNLHTQTPADLCASPPQICSTDPRRFVPEPPHKSAPKPIEEPSYRTSSIEPRRSASPHADAHERENPESEFLIERDSPSGKIAVAESSQGAFREAETKARPKPTEIPRSGQIAKLQRKPVQIDMIAEDAKRLLRETMIAFRKVYPTGPHCPIDDDDWKKVTPLMRAALKIAKAADILDGAARYAASGQDPDFIRDPRNWLKDRDWRKPWPKKTPRAAPTPFQTVRQRTHDSIRAKLAEWSGQDAAGEMKDITPNTIIIEG